MNKFTLLGFVNSGLFLWFSFIILTGHYSTQPFISFYSVFKSYASLLIIFVLGLLNAFLVYVSFSKKKRKLSLPSMSALTFISFFWFLFTFIGSLFASELNFLICAILFALIFYFFFKRYSNKVALFLSLGTIVIFMIVLLSSFEEAYCWKMGTYADPTGGKFVKATKEDAKLLAWNNVHPGDEISVAFRAHFACHETFTFPQAILNSYFHK